MRYGMSFVALAAAVLLGLGCNAIPSKPSTPSAPSKPEVPATPAKPATPAAPTTPSAPTAPSTSSAPSAPSSAEVTKAADPVKPAAAAVDKSPIKADVSKIKFKTEAGAELFGWDDGESKAFFYANGLGQVDVKIPADGDYEIVITASCNAAKGENAKFKLSVDGAQVGAETQLKSEDAKDYSFTTALKAGDRKIGTEFTNDIYKEGEYDMNFYLHGVKVVRK